MTSIYAVTLADNQQWAMPIDGSGHFALGELRGAPQPDWRPVPMEILETNEDGSPRGYSDFPWYDAHVLIVRTSAKPSVRDLLRAYGEFLPLSCAGGLEVFNVTAVRDCLDEASSSIIRYEDGEIMDIERPVFRPAGLEGAGVFKLPYRASDIYLTEDIIRRWQATNVHGVAFNLVWSERPDAIARIELAPGRVRRRWWSRWLSGTRADIR